MVRSVIGQEDQRDLGVRFVWKLIHNQLFNIPANHMVIRGTMEPPPIVLNTPSYNRFHFLATEKLNGLVGQSTIHISRSGYSTAMDLTYPGMPASLIPTPGQIEQE